MNLNSVVRIVGGPTFRGLGDSSWEQPGHMFSEPNEEAFGLSKEGLRAGEEEIWRGSGGSRTVFSNHSCSFSCFSCFFYCFSFASKVEVGNYFHFLCFLSSGWSS